MNKLEEGIKEFEERRAILLSELQEKTQAFSDEYPSINISIVLSNTSHGNVEKGKVHGSMTYNIFD